MKRKNIPPNPRKTKRIRRDRQPSVSRGPVSENINDDFTFELIFFIMPVTGRITANFMLRNNLQIIIEVFSLNPLPPKTVSKVDLEEIPVVKYGKGVIPQTECSICLLPYRVGQRLRSFKCGHYFHCKCVDKWLLGFSDKCPMCRICVMKGVEMCVMICVMICVMKGVEMYVMKGVEICVMKGVEMCVMKGVEIYL
ncbi:hypothetical protein CWI39_0278p0020 [Hamiltosporidium magnivora]|uniref:RING-type domain-containing protein n=1 Tax=Hamiltosporidium magnivora TaxID=148818 RepID=A0A4Q9LK86_9MICR|nr:hypothetical protein CWI39_0278p0020 [Hamiltosporidium magnivora]